MKFKKNIKLFLLDGSVSGRWICELSNWSGKAYRIPRNHLKECDNRGELHTSGIYFLFGINDESNTPLVYIGESEDVLKRLQQHLEEKDYWNEAVIFISKDDNLNKAHIKYLENEFYTMAKEAARYEIKNSNNPTRSTISEAEEAELEEFIYNIKILLYTLGHKAFEKIETTNSTNTEELFYFQRRNGLGGKGIGKPSSEGFIIFKDSYVNPKQSPTLQPWIKTLRIKHADKIQNNLMITDILFSSPSAASAFLSGTSSNGQIEWKTKDGVTLKEWEKIDCI
jgi:hypothetical protein